MGLFERGNPGGPGRPKQKPFLDWCRKWTVEQGEKYLLPIAEDEKNKQQLDAIKTIFAYGIGKPQETVESSHQFEGMEANPNQAKELLGQLIAGETMASVGLSEGSGVVAPDIAVKLPSSKRGARKGDSGNREP